MSTRVQTFDVELRAITAEHDLRLRESELAQKAFALEVAQTRKSLRDTRKSLADNKKELRNYRKEADKAAKSSKSIRDALSSGKVKAAAGLVATVYVLKELVQFADQFITQQGQIARELNAQAAAANVNATTLQDAAYAFGQYGLEGNKAGDVLKDFQDKLGDFSANGSGGMADFMNDIWLASGRTVGELQRLSGPDALIAVKQAMEEANVPMGEQIHYLESIASDASKLIPLLEDGGKRYKELAKEAGEFNNSMTQVQLDEWRELSNYLDEAKSSFKAVLVEAIRPAIDDMADLAKKTGQWLGLLRSDVAKDELKDTALAVENVARQWNKVNEEIQALESGEIVQTIRYDGDHIYSRESNDSRVEFRQSLLKELEAELKVRNDILIKQKAHVDEMSGVSQEAANKATQVYDDIGDIQKDIDEVTKELKKEAKERLKIEQEVLRTVKSRTQQQDSLYQKLFGQDKKEPKEFKRNFAFEADAKSAKRALDDGLGGAAKHFIDQAEAGYRAAKNYGSASNYDLQGMKDVIIALREAAGIDYQDPDRKRRSSSGDGAGKSIVELTRENGDQLKLVAENSKEMAEKVGQYLDTQNEVLKQVNSQNSPSKKFVLELAVPGKNKKFSVMAESKEDFESSMASLLEGAAAGI